MKTPLSHPPNRPPKTPSNTPPKNPQGRPFGALSSSQRAMSLALACILSWGTLAGIDRLATMPPSDAVMAHLHLHLQATDTLIISTAPVAFQ